MGRIRGGGKRRQTKLVRKRQAQKTDKKIDRQIKAIEGMLPEK